MLSGHVFQEGRRARYADWASWHDQRLGQGRPHLYVCPERRIAAHTPFPSNAGHRDCRVTWADEHLTASFSLGALIGIYISRHLARRAIEHVLRVFKSEIRHHIFRQVSRGASNLSLATIAVD